MDSHKAFVSGIEFTSLLGVRCHLRWPQKKNLKWFSSLSKYGSDMLSNQNPSGKKVCLLLIVPPASLVGVAVCVLSQFSHVQLFVTLWTVARKAPLSLGFPRQEYCSGLPFPSPRDLPHLGIKPESPVSVALTGEFFSTEPPGKSSLVGVWGVGGRVGGGSSLSHIFSHRNLVGRKSHHPEPVTKTDGGR